MAMIRGEQVWKLRITLGMSGADFAKKIGVSRAAVNLWERGGGINETNTGKIMELAKKYRIPIPKVEGSEG